MRRRTFLSHLAAGGAAAAAGCVTGAASGDYDVGMQSNAFLPETYEATVGETVVWLNTGSRYHTVTAYEDEIPSEASYFASGGFDSEAAARRDFRTDVNGGGMIPPGERYEHTFEVPGTYGYFCIPHEPAGMVGTVVVREK